MQDGRQLVVNSIQHPALVLAQRLLDLERYPCVCVEEARLWLYIARQSGVPSLVHRCQQVLADMRTREYGYQEETTSGQPVRQRLCRRPLRKASRRPSRAAGGIPGASAASVSKGNTFLCNDDPSREEG